MGKSFLFKSKFVWIMLCIVFVFALGTPAAGVESSIVLSYYINGILEHELSAANETSIQNWLDGELSRNASSSDWYAISLLQYDSLDLDFTKYAKALLEYVNKEQGQSAATKQKYALILGALGCENADFAVNTVNTTIGTQGIMSLVFGLHLINNGYVAQGHTAESVINDILSRVNEDGGWSLSGKVSDADVTSMVITALAPYYNDNTSVHNAVDNALLCLSKMQDESGEFKSYGVKNCESAAQVLCALSALGIDAKSDERFIKNSTTILDTIISYKLDNGSYSHVKNGGESDIATVQVLCALIAYNRFLDGNGSLYIFDKKTTDVSDDLLSPPKNDGGDSNGNEKEEKSKIPLAIGCIAIFIALIIGVRIKLKKDTRVDRIILIVMFICGILAAIMVNAKSPEEYYGATPAPKENAIGKVTISITCDAIKGEDNKYIPKDGVILPATSYEICEGETVYDILIEAARYNNIHIDNDTASVNAYIKGINYIYHFDFGELSGWEYRVNSVTPSQGCQSYVLKDGDVIEWVYVLDIGIAEGGDQN